MNCSLASYLYTIFQYQTCVYRTKDQYDRSHEILSEMLKSKRCKDSLSDECILVIESFRPVWKRRKITWLFTYGQKSQCHLMQWLLHLSNQWIVLWRMEWESTWIPAPGKLIVEFNYHVGPNGVVFHVIWSLQGTVWGPRGHLSFLNSGIMEW